MSSPNTQEWTHDTQRKQFHVCKKCFCCQWSILAWSDLSRSPVIWSVYLPGTYHMNPLILGKFCPSLMLRMLLSKFLWSSTSTFAAIFRTFTEESPTISIYLNWYIPSASLNPCNISPSMDPLDPSQCILSKNKNDWAKTWFWWYQQTYLHKYTHIRHTSLCIIIIYFCVQMSLEFYYMIIQCFKVHLKLECWLFIWMINVYLFPLSKLDW